MRPLLWARAATVALALLPAWAADADDGSAPFRDTYGEVGLLEIPSARMADDGQLSLTVGALESSTRTTLGFQIFPWLEGAFRYSSIDHFNGRETDFDRSFGLKARLFQETEYTPDISLGIRDIVGTGIYGGEYLVATKQIWDFDVTAGLGWGRLAGSESFDNPFGALFSSFKRRPPPGASGQVDFGQIFHGPDMGVFGGIQWRTPIDNLDVVAEYSPDQYTRERAAHSFTPRAPVDVGLSYRPLESLTVTGGWLYGTSWGVVASLAIDPTKAASPGKLGPPPVPVQTRSDQDQVKAVTGFVKNSTNEASLVAGGPWVGSALSKPDAKVALVSQIANSSAAVRDAEVDGRTLVVDVRSGAVNSNECRKYARIAAASGAPVDSVAIVDLNRGNPVLCPAPHPQLARTIYASLEQMETFDDNTTAAPVDDTTVAPPAPQPDIIDVNAVESSLRTTAAAQGLRIEAVGIGAHEIVVYYSNTTYYLESDAIGRLARVLLATTPASVESMRLVAVVSGVPQQEVDVLRAPLERMFTQQADPIEIQQAITLKPPPLDHPLLDAAQSDSYPRFTWSLSPIFRQELFDPNEPLQVQLLAAAGGKVEIVPGLAINTQLEGNIYNDFKFSPSNSLLPHVRSDFAEYLKHGENGIANLYASYDTRFAPDVFFEVRAGYLEDMFGGGGVQALWRPEGLRWAVGVDVYDVWQRNFDRLFGFRNYHVVTGHVNVYYQSPWYDLNFSVHAGRYLARDYGTTFEVTREFSTGVEIGAFATFTNVPFAKFGEGSFDKGIVIHIPLGWALPFNTQSAYDLDLRPLTRDGGQRLENDDSLYEETRRTSYGEIFNHTEEIGYP
ncbi:MAG TPA: YjbH domain-containing protein [Rhizomicrobium sp.]|nr:YjbH domain-containing protein [Rhizomicrobium sp.]